MPVTPQLNLAHISAALNSAAVKLNGPTLRHKISWLQQHRSPDPLQQMQSDAICDLYDAVRQIQEAIWPILLIIPDTNAASDAAGGALPTFGNAKSPFRRF